MKYIKKLKLYAEKFKNEEAGAIYINFLFIFFGTLMVIMMFTSMFVLTAQTHKVNSIVDRATELRAQQIDIPLKEGFGIIEALHPSNAAGYAEIDRELTLEAGYDYEVIKPSDFRYNAYREQVDQDLKNSIVEQISGLNDEKLKTTPEDICIEVLPLPDGKGEKIDVSCRFADGSIETKGFYIDGKDHSSNKIGNYQVENAVIVFVRYQIENKMASLFTDNPIKENVTSSLAYPLVEDCAVRSGC